MSVAVEEEILRFQVPVNDVLRVKVVEGANDFARVEITLKTREKKIDTKSSFGFGVKTPFQKTKTKKQEWRIHFYDSHKKSQSSPGVCVGVRKTVGSRFIGNSVVLSLSFPSSAKQDLDINPESLMVSKHKYGTPKWGEEERKKRQKFPVHRAHHHLSWAAQVQGLLGQSGSMCSRCAITNNGSAALFSHNRSRKNTHEK